MQKKNGISFIVHSFIFCCIALLLPTTVAAQGKSDKVDLLVTGGTVVTMDGQRQGD